jgi:hypothetical protein
VQTKIGNIFCVPDLSVLDALLDQLLVLIHQSALYLLHVVTIHEALTLDQLELFVMVVRITKERGGCWCCGSAAIFASTTLGFTLGARGGGLRLDRRQAASKSATVTSSLFRERIFFRAKRWHAHYLIPGENTNRTHSVKRSNATLSRQIFLLKSLHGIQRLFLFHFAVLRLHSWMSLAHVSPFVPVVVGARTDYCWLGICLFVN